MGLAAYTVSPDSVWVLQVSFFLLGACMGSFLNVCIDRIPNNQSVIRPPSSCQCGRNLAWYEMVPLLSWLFLRGKARCCGDSLTARYPLVELMTGLLFVGSWELLAPVPALIGMGFGFMLLGAAFIDGKYFIIPDGFSIGLMGAGIGLSFGFPELHGYAGSSGLFLIDSLRSGFTAIIGTIVGSGTILWVGLLGEKVFKKEAMGMGDVKLLGGIGAFCGWEGALFSLLGGAILGTVLLVPWCILQLFLKKEASSYALRMAAPVPFGPMLAAAALLYYLLLQSWVDAYFMQFQSGIFR